MSYKDIIHTYLILNDSNVKIRKVFIRIASPRASSPNSSSLTACARSNPSHKQLDFSPVDQNIANTNRRNDTRNITPNFNILVPY